MHPAQYPDDDESNQKEQDERRHRDDSESQVDVQFYDEYLPVENGKIQVNDGVQDQQDSVSQNLLFHDICFYDLKMESSQDSDRQVR